MSENNRSPVSFVNFALALASDYNRLFVINADDDSYAEYSPDKDSKELVRVSSGEDFFSDVHRDCREQVWEEDQEYFLNAFRKEAVTRALNGGSSFSLTYRLNIGGEPRYHFLKTIRASDRSIIIGVQNIDEQKRRELENEKERRIYAEIAESLASLFEVIYHIDIETGHYIQYSSSETYDRLGLPHGGEDFFSKSRRDIEKIIHPDDRVALLNRIDRDSLVAELRKNGTVSIVYRQILDGRTQYVNLIAFFKQGDSDKIVMGVRNIDDQIRQENEIATYSHIAAALSSRYEVIYYIDTETNEYTQYSSSADYAKLGTTKQGSDFFKTSAEDIKKYIHRHDAEKLLGELQKEHLLAELANKGTISLIYRQLLGTGYCYMNMVIVKPKNDNKHIIMGVQNIDAQMKREQTMEKENRTFADMSMALALQYEVIYHVDLKTNAYSEYSASEKYSRLEIGTVGKDFFADTARNMVTDIYPDDLPMMLAAMKKENLLKRLSEDGKTFINYRLILDGRPQYVSLYAVRAKEDSDHIIVAVANVDAAKRMELEYQSAVDLANRDALTSVKNKRAYAQTEMEIDEQISQGTQQEFAVVICDLNGLKKVNDTQGHNAGDAYIKSGCSIICEVFDHSPVFRIGGDEFAVIVRGRDYEQRGKLMERFYAIQEKQKASGLVTVACGISDFNIENDMRVQDVFERADALMYENKKTFK